jgi:hypothetical protein
MPNKRYKTTFGFEIEVSEREAKNLRRQGVLVEDSEEEQRTSRTDVPKPGEK